MEPISSLIGSAQILLARGNWDIFFPLIPAMIDAVFFQVARGFQHSSVELKIAA
jgi:hypothetical protein